MQKILFSNQADKLLAILLLLAVLAAGYGFVRFIYLEELTGLFNELDLKKRKNAKIDSILANEKEIRARIKKQKSILARNRIFLGGRNPATAISELENYVKKLVTRHSDAKIQTIKPYPVEKFDDYAEASLEVRIREIGHQGLHKVLYQFESNSPVLLIKELDIRWAQIRYSELIASGEEQKKLAVTLVVSGFFRDTLGEGQ